MTGLATSIGASSLAHGVHYTVLGIGLLGLFALLAPGASGRHRMSADADDHERRVAALRQSLAAGATVSGVGLGLHVVRTLAEAHDGSATYAPAPGGGAVFTLALPAVTPD